MLPKTIPDKLPGTVIPQYVRCGKPNCKCARGELHGPYWYRFWREDGYTLRKEYIRKADLEKVRAACRAHADDVLEGRALIKTGRSLIRRLARRDESRFASLNRLEALLAAHALQEEIDRYFWAEKGTWRQHLGVVYIQDDIYAHCRGKS